MSIDPQAYTAAIERLRDAQMTNDKLKASHDRLLEALRRMEGEFNHPGLFGLVSSAGKHGWQAHHVAKMVVVCNKARSAIAEAEKINAELP